MAEAPAKFFLTTPIYYVNARPHIGHAYTTIVADVLARRHRLLSDDTYFLTGTDEHGQKIERSALAAGIPPQQFADQVSSEFRTLWDRMGLTYDQFIRTTDPAHKRGVQKLFAELQARGHIYLSSYTGQYCVSEEIFVEGPPGTIGPDGRPTETVTEENYFFRLSAFQLPLLDLIESDTLRIRPESRKNEILSFLRGDLNSVVAAVYDRTLFESNDDLPAGYAAPVNLPLDPLELAEVAGQVKRTVAGTSYLPGALRDLSISRSSFTWGVPVPSNEKHVIYVWLDALANYMTAVGYGDDSAEAQAKFARYWPADLHIVGKEITRQHCIYWPAFLLAAGLPLPKEVVAHGWLLFEESKMSKSKGNIVRTETILDAFGTLCPPPSAPSPPLAPPQNHVILSAAKDPCISSEAPPTLAPTPHDRDLFAADVLRYFLLREIPFGQDGSFSFDALITRYNADLANGYGNLVSRTLNLVIQSFSGGEVIGRPTGSARIPPLSVGKDDLARNFSDELSQRALGLIASTKSDIDTFFSLALQRIAEFIQQVDSFLTREKPWSIASRLKSSAETLYQSSDQQAGFAAEMKDLHIRLEAILYTAAESIRIITALLYPILPYATASVWQQLGLGSIEEAAARGDLNNLQWGGLKPGTRLGPLSPIFPRADKGLAQIMTDIESANALKPAPSKFVNEPYDALAQAPVAPTDPAAAPRTGTFTEPSPGLQVAGSTAETTERQGTPSHHEANPSGIFSLSQVAGPSDGSPQIAIDDFAKVELRVAQIVVAERIPKADKLLRLEVDLGYEKRQILSGIAEWYTPEELIGRRIVVVTNLAPRKMRGLESHGMLLAASNGENGKPVLATFSEEIALGSRIK